MNNLHSFLRENAEKTENRKTAASDRFRDENGDPIEWEIRVLSESEIEQLRKESSRSEKVGSQMVQTVDEAELSGKMVAAAVVYPDLYNAQLQDSYRVKTPEDLVKEMLTFAEYQKLSSEIADLNGITDLAEDIEEAKN